MKMKKIGILLLLTSILLFSPNPIYAITQNEVQEAQGGTADQGEKKVEKRTIQDIMEDADAFLKNENTTNNVSFIREKDLRTVTKSLYNIFFGIGVAATVVVGAILGIQYMAAAVEEKAKVKESLEPFIIGCIIIYGGFGIWRVIMLVGSAFEAI